jgi:hypothetical protein
MTLDDPPQPGVRRYVIATISQPTTKQSETPTGRNETQTMGGNVTGSEKRV